MDYEILKDRTQAPAQDDAIWTFIVAVRQPDGITPTGLTEEVRHQISDIDLQGWAQQALGRSLKHTEGTDKELADLNSNWTKLEPWLKTDVERNLGRQLKQ